MAKRQPVEDQIARDRRFMVNRASWPQWPYLPLKRYDANRRMEIAVLYASDPYKVAFGANLFDLRAAKWTETTVDALIADKWTID